MPRTVRLLGIVGLMAVSAAVSCTPATPLGNTIQIPLDPYCTLEARASADASGIAVAAHTFGAQFGVEPNSGCGWYTLVRIDVTTDQGSFSCIFRGPGAPSQVGSGVGCSTYSELGGLITWDQTWAPGAVVSASVGVSHLDAVTHHQVLP